MESKYILLGVRESYFTVSLRNNFTHGTKQMEINKEQKYKWARRMIPIWWHQLKVAKKEGRIVEFEGFPPVLRKYEKSLKLFLELLSKE